MADGKFAMDETKLRAKKANECIACVKHLKPPKNLFDEFWREGELTLFFGPSGTGKSILAVQIAESIARGRPVFGKSDVFMREANVTSGQHQITPKGETPTRRKVLYVDLKFSERQFGMRYSVDGKQYKLSENLYRDRPPADIKLIDWLRKMIADNGFRTVIIDDLSAVRQTYDGTRETLKLMRELKQLKEEMDLSILVVASSHDQRRSECIAETHLMRSRVLCDAADSVFAIGVHAGNPKFRYLIQTRSQSAVMKWQMSNVPVCSIQRSEDGFIGMVFDERFVAEVDEETRQMICNVKWAHDAGASFRDIADDLGISKSTAARLCKKWTPALEKGIVMQPEFNDAETPTQRRSETEGPREKEEWELYSDERPIWFESDEAEGGNASVNERADEDGGMLVNARGSARGFYPKNAHTLPFLASLKRIHITDLKHGIDGYGRDVFILKEQHHDGKPLVWFQYDSKGKIIRKDRDSWGVSITHLNSPWISAKINLQIE